MEDAEEYELYETRKKLYTYADYLKWDDKVRCELIDGVVYEMASPSVQHQAILMNLSKLFSNWLEGKPCRVFAAPLDVRLFPRKDFLDRTVVQPDLLVVCKKEKIDKNSINGAPDLVIEILSPSNSVSEMLNKFQAYQQSGVKEYWIIDPDNKKVQVNIFEGGKVLNTYFLDDEKIPVKVLPGLEINLKDIWSQ